MERSTLQAKEYRQLYEQCRHSRNYAELSTLVRKVVGSPDVLPARLSNSTRASS